MITAFDLETHLLAPGMVMPRMVCLSWATSPTEFGLVLRDEGLKLARSWLKGGRTLVGHNICFDLGVLCAEDESFIPLVFQALDEGRIRDTMLREKLLNIASGDFKFHHDDNQKPHKTLFTLQSLVAGHLNKIIDKSTDTWRLRYSELDGVPVDEWPEAAKTYAIGDAVDTLAVYVCQDVDVVEKHKRKLEGETSTMAAAWALHLMGAWGLRTDDDMVIKLKSYLENDYAAAVARAKQHGLVRSNGKRDLKAIRSAVQAHYLAHGLKIPTTNKQQVSTSRETLNNGKHLLVPKHQGLEAIGDLVRIQKLLKTYVSALEKGTVVPITPNYNVLVESFRTSCSGGKNSTGMNVQNPPRKGGIRECFRPRPGNVYVFADYATLELRTLAQSCLDLKNEVGVSRMADVLREGKDLHLEMAAEITGIVYAELFKLYKMGDVDAQEARRFAKTLNFGAPGGLGYKSFIEYARASDIVIDEKKSQDLLASYKRNWPEMEKYFTHVSNACTEGAAPAVIHPRTKMVRGEVRYTAMANHYFQHLAAIGAKDALYQVSRECYLKDLRSPLYGCRPVLFLHDEIGMEVPYNDPVHASKAADRLSEVMVERMKFWCPDVPIEAEPVMTRRWLKGAEGVRVDGLLVPSRQEGKKWVPDIAGLPGWEARAA